MEIVNIPETMTYKNKKQRKQMKEIWKLKINNKNVNLLNGHNGTDRVSKLESREINETQTKLGYFQRSLKFICFLAKPKPTYRNQKSRD